MTEPFSGNASLPVDSISFALYDRCWNHKERKRKGIPIEIILDAKRNLQEILFQTTASTMVLCPRVIVFTPISFFLLKLKLNIYPLF